MSFRTLVAFLALVGLVSGPTGWAVERCGQPVKAVCKCCASKSGAGGASPVHRMARRCCGAVPAKPNGSIPIAPDRTDSGTVVIELPMPVAAVAMVLQPPVASALGGAIFRSAPDHGPPVLSRTRILLI